MLFDVDGDGDKEVVDSIETPYDANRDLKYDIEVVAYDSNGNDLVALGKANVTYYDSEGREVKGALTDAGTYTLKVTSHDYKLTGTTEMTITISPVYVGGVKSGAPQAAQVRRHGEPRRLPALDPVRHHHHRPRPQVRHRRQGG